MTQLLCTYSFFRWLHVRAINTCIYTAQYTISTYYYPDESGQAGTMRKSLAAGMHRGSPLPSSEVYYWTAAVRGSVSALGGM